MTYPYEVESDSGVRWVFNANDAGWFILSDVKLAARLTLEQVLSAIDGRNPELHRQLFVKECKYHGKLRRETPAPASEVQR